MGTPTLSVAVLNYNYARFLPQCLESILGQTFEAFEVIVIDDASHDDSRAVLARYDDPRLRIIRHEQNAGFTASLIEASDCSRGEFLMVISADDFALDAHAFERQLALLAEPDVGFCFNAFVKFGPGDSREVRRLLRSGGVISGKEFVRRQLTDREFGVLHSGTMIRATSFREAGGYGKELHNYLDLALWLELAMLGRAAYVAEPLYAYRIHGAQYSGSAGRRRAVLREGLAVLGNAARRARATGIELSTEHVLRARIADLALADAFAERRTLALKRCWDCVRLSPGAAVRSSGWRLALMRSLLPDRAWNAAASAKRRVRRHPVVVPETGVR
jgi:glycosyltransferase involved in cell wall biosynthesis